jgi:hypothetical protein
MGAHQVPLQGVQQELTEPGAGRPMPDFVSFYRWHLPDPIVFRERIRVTLQQIGAVPILKSQSALRQRIDREGRIAGAGWTDLGDGSFEAFGICERQDDVCATAYLYLREPQAVPQLELANVLADIERRPWESASPFELALAPMIGD